MKRLFTASVVVGKNGLLRPKRPKAIMCHSSLRIMVKKIKITLRKNLFFHIEPLKTTLNIPCFDKRRPLWLIQDKSCHVDQNLRNMEKTKQISFLALLKNFDFALCVVYS